LGAAYLSLCKYKKWVVKESVLLRRREGDDMLTHPHNKILGFKVLKGSEK